MAVKQHSIVAKVQEAPVVGYLPADTPPWGAMISLAFQQVLTMFPATVLVAILTKFDVGVTLLASGVGTIIALLVSSRRIPMYYGSSFSYIAAYLGIAQAMGHKPGAKYTYSAPPVFLFEPHQPEMCNFKPQVILNIDEVWEIKRKTFEILAAQKHLWAYYERVALQRGVQGGRNTGKPMTYGEAYQRLFPMALEELA
mgnify:CR=1 FL=1